MSDICTCHRCQGPGCRRMVAGTYCESCQRRADERAKHQAAIAARLSADPRLQTADKLPNRQSVGTTLRILPIF